MEQNIKKASLFTCSYATKVVPNYFFYTSLHTSLLQHQFVLNAMNKRNVNYVNKLFFYLCKEKRFMQSLMNWLNGSIFV